MGDLIERMCRVLARREGARKCGDSDADQNWLDEHVERVWPEYREDVLAIWAEAAEPGRAIIITSCIECGATVTGVQVGWQLGTDFQWRCPEHMVGQAMHGAAISDEPADEIDPVAQDLWDDMPHYGKD